MSYLSKYIWERQDWNGLLSLSYVCRSLDEWRGYQRRLCQRAGLRLCSVPFWKLFDYLINYKEKGTAIIPYPLDS